MEVTQTMLNGKSFILNGYAKGWVGDARYLTLKLNNTWYTFLEDLDDVYRSMIDAITISIPEHADLISLPAIRVDCELQHDVYVFTEQGSPVARCGTEWPDEYYPCCVLELDIAAMSFNRNR